MFTTSLDLNLLEVSAHVLLKLAAKSSLSVKKNWDIAFLGYFSKA